MIVFLFYFFPIQIRFNVHTGNIAFKILVRINNTIETKVPYLSYIIKLSMVRLNRINTEQPVPK